VTKSTTIIAFDQHAATTVAAVLLPGQWTPALHTLTSDSPTVLRFLERLRRAGPVRCCYEAGPCGFELQRALMTHRIPCDVIAPSLIRGVPAIASKPTGAMRVSLPCCTAPARSRRFIFPPSRKKPLAICCAVGRTKLRGPSACRRSLLMRSGSPRSLSQRLTPARNPRVDEPRQLPCEIRGRNLPTSAGILSRPQGR
jgi:hypothetical protein